MRSEHESTTTTAGRVLPVVLGHSQSTLIVIADNAHPATSTAADLLQHYIWRATGARLPLLPESALSGVQAAATLYVGRHRRFDTAGPVDELRTLVDDGFLHWPDGPTLTLVGPTARGTEHAVLEFLEQQVGVRWLMPGANGEDVPQLDKLVVSLRPDRQEPWARSRMMFPLMSRTALGGAEGYEWGRRNRLHGGIEFGHALWRILPPAKYAGRHRNWYPRSLPAARYGWQPRFSSPETVAAAVAETVEYFARNPDVDSVSLAVNDYSGFCETDVETSGRRNSAGFPDMSDVYFGWVNAVADGVLRVHPRKRFGVLAYHDVLDPPSFDLHPAVIPFITGDRITWSTPLAGDRGRRLTEAWAGRAHELGWWEYLHGAHYAVPKVFFDQLQRNMRFAARQRVRHHFGESWPDWGGGPQPWIIARLQWNPNQDVGDLLSEWCSRAVGPAAADALVEYYRRWEACWSDRMLSSDWYRRRLNSSPRSDYLRFDDPSYLSLTSEDDWTTSRRLLDAVATRAPAGAPAARARLLRCRLDYYRESLRHYNTGVDIDPEVVPASEVEGVALVDRMASRFRQGLLPLAIHRQITPDEVLDRMAHLPTTLDRAGLHPTFGPGASAALLAWLRGHPQDDTVREHLAAIAEQAAPPLSNFLCLVLRAADPDAALTTLSDVWTIVCAPGGSLRFDDGVAGRSLIAHGAWSGDVTREVRLPAGTYGVIVEYTSPGHTGTGSLQIAASFAGSDTSKDGVTARSPHFRTWRSAGSGSTAEAIFAIPGPENAAGHRERLPVTLNLIFSTTIEGPSFPCMAPDESVQIDRVGLYKLDPCDT